MPDSNLSLARCKYDVGQADLFSGIITRSNNGGYIFRQSLISLLVGWEAKVALQLVTGNHNFAVTVSGTATPVEGMR